MKLLVLALATVALARHPGFDKDGHPTSRIVGGVEVSPPLKYPFMVRGRGCGGLLIAPEWVLTAGHCVNTNNPGNNGPLFLNRHESNTGGFPVTVTQVVRHPSYGGNNESDTALLKISPPVTTITPIPLDSGRTIHSEPGQINTVIGWGALSEGGPQSQTLQEVSLPVITNEKCAEVLNINMDTEICMGKPEGGQDACQGDSGGPMFYQDANGGNLGVTGVVSWGIGCARPNLYGVYARVSSVLDFILAHATDATVTK